jgi:hypothetical protein
MVGEFLSWFSDNEKRLRELGIAVVRKNSWVAGEKPGAHVGLESEVSLASFTVWVSGEVEIIILDKDSNKERVVADLKVQMPQELPTVLEQYCKQVAG